MTRGEPEENKPNAQGQDGVIGNDGGSVPDTDGGGDDREDTVPGGAAPDAAAGAASGGEGGDAEGGAWHRDADDPRLKIAPSKLEDLDAVKAYMSRLEDMDSVSGVEVRGLRKIVVWGNGDGRYRERLATITFTQDARRKVWRHYTYSPAGNDPTPFAPDAQEEKDLLDALTSVDRWPTHDTIDNPSDRRAISQAPPELAQAPERNLLFYRDAAGRLVWVQQRVDFEDGTKAYLPWSRWDGVWERREPDGLLPLWGLDQLKTNTTVFLHEGAKAARAMREMIEAKTPDMKAKLASHPWCREMQNAAHIGWAGGAKNPGAVDWSPLCRHDLTIYIVADNDAPGLDAVVKVSKLLRNAKVFRIEFDSRFSSGFDLGDDFPARLFAWSVPDTYEEYLAQQAMSDGEKMAAGVKRIYVGPSFHDCKRHGTYIGDRPVKPKAGQDSLTIRAEAKVQYVYASRSKELVNINFPHDRRKPEDFDAEMAKFADGHSESMRKMARVCRDVQVTRWVPSEWTASLQGNAGAEIIISDGKHERGINIFKHSPIYDTAMRRPLDGVPRVEPFLFYMNYMFPNRKDRDGILDWCTTLVAKPHLRMNHGLLLVTEAQGIGKTTLPEAILAPLVGVHNTYSATEENLTEKFNGWMEARRLITINEIYSGHSFKVYTLLKSPMTEDHISIRRMQHDAYTTDNHLQIIACSNTEEAIKMDEGDRRWRVPELPEHYMNNDRTWHDSWFAYFRKWLRAGGLLEVMHFFIQRAGAGQFLPHKSNAPEDQPRRTKMIRLTSHELGWAHDWCKEMIERQADEAFVFSTQLAMELAHEHSKKLRLDIYRKSSNALAKPMRDAGMVPLTKVLGPDGPRMSINLKGEHTVYLSPKAVEEFGKQPEEARRAWLIERLQAGRRSVLALIYAEERPM